MKWRRGGLCLPQKENAPEARQFSCDAQNFRDEIFVYFSRFFVKIFVPFFKNFLKNFQPNFLKIFWPKFLLNLGKICAAENATAAAPGPGPKAEIPGPAPVTLTEKSTKLGRPCVS